MEIYGWCIMPSYVHLIFRDKNGKPAELLGKFKEHTSKTLRKAIAAHLGESRKEWMLWMMQRAAAKNSSVSEYQRWQHHNKPIELWTEEVILQKLNLHTLEPSRSRICKRTGTLAIFQCR